MLWSEIYTAEWSRLELLLWQAPLGPCRYCHLFSYAVQCPYRPLEPCAAVSPHVPPAARLLPWCLDRLATSLDHGSHWSTGTSTYSLLSAQLEDPQPPPRLPATLPSPPRSTQKHSQGPQNKSSVCLWRQIPDSCVSAYISHSHRRTWCLSAGLAFVFCSPGCPNGEGVSPNSSHWFLGNGFIPL